MKKHLFVLLMSLSISARAQFTAPDAFAGRWFNDTTGYEIEADHMIGLQYDPNNEGR